MDVKAFKYIFSSNNIDLKNPKQVNDRIAYIQTNDGGVINITNGKNNAQFVEYIDEYELLLISDAYYEGSIRTNQRTTAYVDIEGIQLISVMDKDSNKPEIYTKETIQDEYLNKYKY